MAKYHIMSSDGQQVLCSINSAWSFNGAARSFMFSAVFYCISKYKEVIAGSEFFPTNIIVAKKTTLRGKISGVNFVLFKAVGDTGGIDELRYIEIGPVNQNQLIGIKGALSDEKMRKIEYIKPSSFLQNS
jgi:hypothetical protein